jgi:uncharacterized sulfatase
MRIPSLILIAVMVAAHAGEAPPNIVLIVSDDHAWTDYGFMGHPHLRTPHLDRLAAESLTFTRAYVPSSLCCPSLASIITGRQPHRHRVTSNDPPLPAGMVRKDFQRSQAFLDGRERMNRHLESVPTMPAILAAHGYRSLQTGKWWQGHFSRGGFTHGMTSGGRHGDAGLEIGRRTMRPIEEFITTAVAERAPFLVWYAPLMPHDPHTPPQRLLDRYLPLAPSVHVARYWAMVEWFDETIGELIATLERSGQRDNTIIAYVADNGWIQDPASTAYAPRSKQSQYDGGLRTPLMVSWRGRIAPARSEAVVSSLDLLPTLLAAAGVPAPSGLDGLDLRDGAAVAARRAVFGACYTHDAVDLDDPARNLRWRWVIAEGWKLIVPDAVNEPGAAVELYQLDGDPLERDDHAADEPARVATMRGLLDGWWAGR